MRADQIFSGTDYLPATSVLVLDAQGLLKEIVSQEQVPDSEIEHFNGILTPGFVNAHCHLELSHLKGQIPQKTGLPRFAMEVIKQRGRFSAEQQVEAMEAAEAAMWAGGIVAVGDISNGSDSFETKARSKLYYHTFVELIGLNPKNVGVILDRGNELLAKLEQLELSGSLAPHAPYSASRELIRQIAKKNALEKTPFSIHNQESLEEYKFFNGEVNGFGELYSFLNLDISWYQAPGGTSLKNYGDVLNTERSILVHNTFTGPDDIAAFSDKKINWCFCPRANLYIEGLLPEYKLFANQSVCLGTDSLASNLSLDLVEEINAILENSKFFDLETLLRSATFDGAKALGIESEFGRLIKNKNVGLNLLQRQGSRIKFIKKVS